jgi:hypothetical protein
MSTIPVEIHIGPTFKNSQLIIDGKDIAKNVRSFTLHGVGQEITKLTIELVNIKVDVEAVAQVELDGVPL